eukprot:7094656-Alexandrium_andersonii.AAC.1
MHTNTDRHVCTHIQTDATAQMQPHRNTDAEIHNQPEAHGHNNLDAEADSQTHTQRQGDRQTNR